MYFLLVKAYSYDEVLIHSDLVVSIVPNGQLITIFTPQESHECIYVKGIDDTAMREKCRQWIEEIFEEEKE